MFQFMKIMTAMGMLCRAPLTDDEAAKLKSDHDAALKKMQDDHKAELEKLKNPKKKVTPDPDEDDENDDEDDLSDKARKEREDKEKKAGFEKSLESALNFNIGSKNFLKDNEGLLPKNIESIFSAADKEKYDSAIEKANAIKVGIVSEYFAVQANHDFLTGAQKIEVDNFLKLTKNGKQEKVESVYSMIFEPTLETQRKVLKAKELNTGDKNQTSAEKALADRMMKASKKHYLGDKE